jgi:C-terminal processing protease CtpA/Prc
VKTTTAVWIPLLLCAAALLVPARHAAAQSSSPPPPAPSPPGVAPPDDKALEAQLEDARRKLDAAAHEFAALSAQMSGPLVDKLTAFVSEHGRAVLGVQLDGAAPGGGARVREVSPGGPAAEAGIRAGDVIVAVNGTKLTGEQPAHQVMDLMRDVKPDSKVSVHVLRDGKPHDYTVTVRGGPLFLADDDMNFVYAPMPPMPPPMVRGALADMELVTLTPQLGRYFGAEKGVLVVRAPTDGTLKLQDGDVILAIDGRQPTSGSHATRILTSYQPGEKLALRVIRDHKTLELQAIMPERAMHDAHAHPDMQPRVIAIAPHSDET